MLVRVRTRKFCAAWIVVVPRTKPPIRSDLTRWLGIVEAGVIRHRVVLAHVIQSQMIDSQSEAVLRRLIRQKFQYSVFGVDFTNRERLAGDAVGEWKRFVRAVSALRRDSNVQSRHLYVVDELVDSNQSRITSANRQSLHGDEWRQVFPFAVQEVDTLGHEPGRKVRTVEFMNRHLSSEAIL